MMATLVWKIAGGAAVAALFGGGAYVANNPALRMAVMGPPNADASFSQTAQTTAVPFDFFRHARIYLKGRVNDVPTDFMLDSGAGMSVIDKAYAQRIGIQSAGEMMVHGQSGARPGGIATSVTLDVGGVRLTNATLLILDLSEISGRIGRPIPLILGRDIFDSSVVDLDFEKQTVAFRDPASFAPPKGAVRLSLERTHGGTRALPAVVNGLPPVIAAFDLGQGGSMIVSQPYWQAQNLLANLKSSEMVEGGFTNAKSRKVGTLRSVAIGGTTFHDVPASFNSSPGDLPPEGVNIGIDLLSKFRLFVDYSHDAIYLIPGERTAQPLPKDRSGMRFELADDRLRVTSLSPNGPASQAGFKVGDEILAIDGEKISPRFYFGPHADWGSAAAGTKTVLVMADGARRELTLSDYF